MAARRDLPLFTAVGVSLALAATTLWLPAAPWRVPLAILGGTWAPGYALLSLAYPRGRLTLVERHGLSACAGLCLLPLLALLASESVGLSSVKLALVSSGVTLALALACTIRGVAPADEPVARGAIPSTRVTLAVCVGALALAGAVEATTHLMSKAEPASLAMWSAEGGPLTLRPAVDEPVTLAVVASAGAAPARGDLVVLWDEEVLLQRDLFLLPGEAAQLELVLPTQAAGAHLLEVRWRDLETRATFHIGRAR